MHTNTHQLNQYIVHNKPHIHYMLWICGTGGGGETLHYTIYCELYIVFYYILCINLIGNIFVIFEINSGYYFLLSSPKSIVRKVIPIEKIIEKEVKICTLKIISELCLKTLL